MEIRLLGSPRTADRRANQNDQPVQFYPLVVDPDLEADLTSRTLDKPTSQAKVRRRLAVIPASAQVRVTRSELTHIVAATKEINELLTAQKNPKLRAETASGPVTAAVLIGQTAGAERFQTDAQFARQAGTAPIPVSSDNTNRYRLDRGGNRQLNKALHVIAITRARIDPQARAYLNRKRAEGKTSREAFCCLNRHLARRIWRLLFTPESPIDTAPRTAITTTASAPALMPCTR